MLAATAARIDADNPLAGLDLGERPDPVPPDGWVTVTFSTTAVTPDDGTPALPSTGRLSTPACPTGPVNPPVPLRVSSTRTGPEAT